MNLQKMIDLISTLWLMIGGQYLSWLEFHFAYSLVDAEWSLLYFVFSFCCNGVSTDKLRYHYLTKLTLQHWDAFIYLFQWLYWLRHNADSWIWFFLESWDSLREKIFLACGHYQEKNKWRGGEGLRINF